MTWREISGGPSAWEPALRLLGLWQPDLIRAMLPMACILVINCIVLQLPRVVDALQPLGGEEAGAGAGAGAGRGGGAAAVAGRAAGAAG